MARRVYRSFSCLLLGCVLASCLHDEKKSQVYTFEVLPSPEKVDPLPEGGDHPAREISTPSSQKSLESLFQLYREGVDPTFLIEEVRAIDSDHLTTKEKERYRLLRKAVFLSRLDRERIGFIDNNISALALDHEDLWIGSWAGGVARYSLALDEITLFEEGFLSVGIHTIRDFAMDDERVWVATYSGIRLYDKRRDRWIPFDHGKMDRRVQAILKVDDMVLIGTAGTGLWRYDDKQLTPCGANSWPGQYINTMVSLPQGGVVIGTPDKGAILWDAQGTFIPLASKNDELLATNVTMLLVSGEALWIGTNGEGLYRWERGTNTVTHYTQERGEIPDNWVLSGASSEEILYFGTLGGGIALYTRATRTWSTLTLEEGLPSLEFTTLLVSDQTLYGGTLGSGVVTIQSELYRDGR